MRLSPTTFVFLGVSLSALLVGCASKSVNPIPRIGSQREKFMILNQQVTDQGVGDCKADCGGGRFGRRVSADRNIPRRSRRHRARKRQSCHHKSPSRPYGRERRFQGGASQEEPKGLTEFRRMPKFPNPRVSRAAILEAATETIVPSEADAGRHGGRLHPRNDAAVLPRSAAFGRKAI